MIYNYVYESKNDLFRAKNIIIIADAVVNAMLFIHL